MENYIITEHGSIFPTRNFVCSPVFPSPSGAESVATREGSPLRVPCGSAGRRTIDGVAEGDSSYSSNLS
jgi:hypothetical protein